MYCRSELCNTQELQKPSSTDVLIGHMASINHLKTFKNAAFGVSCLLTCSSVLPGTSPDCGLWLLFTPQRFAGYRRPLGRVIARVCPCLYESVH